VIAAGLAAMGLAHRADATSFIATWASAVDGNWTTAANWSTNPNFPNNGSPGAGDTYDAIIGASGAAYTTSLGSSVTVNSLTMADASATFRQTNGTFRAINGMTLQSGTYVMSFGTISLTNIMGPGSFTINGGVFNAATLSADAVINPTGQNAVFFNGLRLDSNLTIVGGSSANNTRFDTAPVISGTGTVLFGGTSGSINMFQPNGTLTIGPGITVRTSTNGASVGNNALPMVNQGTISAQTAGKGIGINGVGWSNTGTIQAINGGGIGLNGTWNNAGTILIDNNPNSTMALSGSFTQNNIGTFIRAGGIVSIEGTFSNTGSFDLSNIGSIQMNFGTLAGGGTFNAGAANATITVNAGAFNNANLAADVVVSVGANPVVSNGLQLNSNFTVTGGVNASSMAFNGTQSLIGNGTIIYGGTSGSISMFPNGGTLTIGPGITIRTGTNGGSFGNSGTAILNQGTISGQTAGKGIGIFGTNWSNAGTIQAINGGAVALNGSWSNTGTILLDNNANSVITLAGTFSDTGIGTINRAGGTVFVSGTFNNTGTFDLSRIGPIVLSGGTLTGGGTFASGASNATITVNSGFFNNANIAADATVSLSANPIVFNGLQLNSNFTITGGVTVSSIAFNGTQSLIGNGTIIYGGTGGSLSIFPTGGTLTIGSGITIRTGTNGGNLGNNGTAILNQGTISGQTAGKTLSITGVGWSNTGTLQATNGGALALSTLPTNYSSGTFTGGHVYVYAGSTLTFPSGTISSNAADIRLDGANSVFTPINSLATNSGTFAVANGRSFGFAGALTNNATGAIVAAQGGTITIPSGSDSGTIDANNGGTIIFNGNFNHLAGSYLRGSGSVIFNSGIQDFFGTVVGDINVNISGGAANFRAGSTTSVNSLNVSTTNSLFETGATVNVGAGGLNFIGASSPAVALNSGATGAKISLAGNVSVSGNSTGVAQILNSGSGTADGILDLGGAVRTFTVADGSSNPDLLVTATIINGGITKSGPGTMGLSNSNSYAGGSTLTNGTLQASNSNALGTGSVIFSGGTLDLRSDAATTSFTNALTAVTPTTSMLINVDRVTGGAPGAFQFPASTIGSNLAITGNGSVQLSGATLTNDAIIENFVPLEITGPISGNFGITRGGSANSSGTLILSGSSANTYTGITTVSRGVLALNKTGSSAIPADFAINGGTILLQQANQISDVSAGTITNNAVLDLGGFSETVGSMSLGQAQIMNGSLTLTGSSSSTATLTLGQPGKPSVLNNAGTLSVSSSSAFIQSGAGNAINNIGTLLNFSGGTTSILVPFNNSGYIFSTGSLVLSAGGTQSGSFNVAGLLQLGGGHTITSSGSVASNSEIDVVSGPNLFSGLMRSPSIRFTGGVSNLNGIAPGGLQNYPVMVVVDTGAAVNITGGSFTCGEAIGVLGSGTLSQSGGSTYVPANLFLGIGQGSVGIGRYTLSDGTLNASNVHVENGTLEQSGGTFSGGGSSGVFVGGTDGNGTILLSGGAFACNPQTIGYTGNGTFVQSGGLNSSGSLVIGTNGGHGFYSISAGTLAIGNVIFSGSTSIGEDNSAGTLLQTGGIVTMTSSLGMAQYPNSAGSYILQSGTLEVNSSETIAGSPTGTGTFSQSGGYHSTRDISINMNGRYDLSGGTLIATNGISVNGTFNWSGGALSANIVLPAAGHFNIIENANKTLSFGLNINAMARLDVANNRLAINYNGFDGSPIDLVRSELLTGFASGAWNGPGIDSSTAAAIAGVHKTALGYGEASTLGITNFFGDPVDNTTVLVFYTLSGDANFDLQVNTLDFNKLAQNFNQSGKFWTDADFNYDGAVNALDFNAIAANYGATLSSPPALGSLVPEPTAIALATFAVFVLAQRRRR
jgi:autotransporter-associated beta strand protein